MKIAKSDERYTKYIIPGFIGLFLFLIVIFMLESITVRETVVVERDVSETLGEGLITDKEMAIRAKGDPMLVGGYDMVMDAGDPEIRSISINSADEEIIVLVSPNTIINFRNETGGNLELIGISGYWGSTMRSGEGYSQIFQKPGEFPFLLNNQLLGVIRVRQAN